MRTWHLKVAAVVVVVGTFAITTTAQQRAAESRDMTLVGSNDLQARSAYQPVSQKQGNRYIAYIGHHAGTMPNTLNGRMEDNGTSVVDVTNPRQPKYVAHIPGGGEAQGPGQAQMVRTCAGADPAWRTARMTKIYDLSDPAHPVFIRDFGLPGQQPGSTMNPVPTEVHGPISIVNANRVYFGYGTGRYGVVQIVDRKKLLEGPRGPTGANLRYPVIGQLDLPIDAGAHTAFPMLHMVLPEFAKQNWQPVNTNTAQATHAPGEGFAPPTNQGMRDFILTVGETTANE